MVGTALAVIAALYLMLDSRVVRPEPAPAVTSVSLGILAFLFGVGAWAMSIGGRRERTPLLAGLSIGVGTYAVVRVLF